jgi:cation transport ATPase
MVTHRFKTNLNCGSCVAAVKPHLDNDQAIDYWSVDTSNPDKVLTVRGSGVSPHSIERHVSDAGFKVLGHLEEADSASATNATAGASQSSLLTTYWPLLLVFAYLIGLVVIVEVTADNLDWMRAMANFMGGFFIAFSFFKLLDIRSFAAAFQSYDVLARSVYAYGYAYPFIELGLGIAYLTRLAPVMTNLCTLIVMLVGLVGVTQALLQKRAIQCACLGTVFNLPMSKVTFIEDALMAGMALIMLIGLLM